MQYEKTATTSGRIGYPPFQKMLACYEVFKLAMSVKGCVVELGVAAGNSFVVWAHLSGLLEPYNWTRRFIGFDTFNGFPATADKDIVANSPMQVTPGDENWGDHRSGIIEAAGAMLRGGFDSNAPRLELVQGDITETVPQYLVTHPELMVALLYVDCNIYQPTLVGLQHLVPRMPKGAVLVFDELDFGRWPGETVAVQEVLGIRNLRIQQFPWQGQMSYAVLE
jgi:hypothetical protein